MRIYLDVCCLNRPFDDQSQERVRMEAEAVMMILARVETGLIYSVSSEVIQHELSANPDSERRERVQMLAEWH